MQFNIIFKTILEYILKKVVLCIQIHFVSTEKTTCIASRASCLHYAAILLYFMLYICIYFVAYFVDFCMSINLPYQKKKNVHTYTALELLT